LAALTAGNSLSITTAEIATMRSIGSGGCLRGITRKPGNQNKGEHLGIFEAVLDHLPFWDSDRLPFKIEP
jgi:hypothetical protein